jgi:hypothetical protein
VFPRGCHPPSPPPPCSPRMLPRGRRMSHTPSEPPPPVVREVAMGRGDVQDLSLVSAGPFWGQQPTHAVCQNTHDSALKPLQFYRELGKALYPASRTWMGRWQTEQRTMWSVSCSVFCRRAWNDPYVWALGLAHCPFSHHSPFGPASSVACRNISSEFLGLGFKARQRPSICVKRHRRSVSQEACPNLYLVQRLI